MKKAFWVFAVFLLQTFVWSSCSSSKMKTRFQQVYGLLNSHPDSAIFLLGEIEWRKLPEKDQARYCLYYTIAQDKGGLDVQSDTLLGLAYSYYKVREEDSLYAKCLYYMGKYYLLNDSTRKAEDCFTDAIRAAKKSGDYYTTYLALDRLSKSLDRSNPAIAVNYAKDAYRIYEEKFGDNLTNKAFLLLDISNSFSLASETDSARSYLNQALGCALKLGDADVLSSVYQSFSVVLKKQEKKDSALFYSKKAWEIAPKKNAALASNLALAYLLTDSIAQSEELLLALCKAKSIVTRQSAYQLLTECAFRKGDLKLAWEYTDSTLSLYKEKHESALKDKTAYFQSNSEKLLELESMKLTEERQRYIFIGCVMGGVFLLLIMIALYRNRLLLYRNKILQIKQEKEIEALQYRAEQEKQDLRLRQEECQIKMLKAYIRTVVDLQGKIKKAMAESKRDILINENLWLEIEQFLNASESNFVTRLSEKYTSLSQDELRFCMLLRLGFSIKELSEIYCIAEDSIKQKQSKFKHKLGLEKSPVSLRKYLQSF